MSFTYYDRNGIHQVLVALANKLDKNKVTRQEIVEKMLEIIEKKVDEKRAQFESAGRYEIEEKYAARLAEEVQKLEVEKRKLVEADPKYNAAICAVEQAKEAAYLPNDGFRPLCDRCMAEMEPQKKTDQYTRTQLVRTIGLIWSSAFGLSQIGGGPNKPVEDDSRDEV